MDSERLRESVVAWLEKRRERFLLAAQKLGIPPSVQISRPVITDMTDTGFTSSNKYFQASPFALPSWSIALREEVVVTEEDIRCSPAPDLFETFKERCKVWGDWSQHSFEIKPWAWIYEMLLSRVEAEYLSLLPSLEVSDLQVAEQIAKDLVSLAEAEQISIVGTLPLAGIRLAEDRIDVDNISLRKLSADEVAEIADLPNDLLRLRSKIQRLRGAYPRWVAERSALEVRVSCPKSARPEFGYFLKKVVLGLELLGFELHGECPASYWTEPGPSLENGGQSLALGKKGSTRCCTQEDLRRALALAHAIPDGAVSSPATRQEVVLHRFLLGNAEDYSADKLIDFVIAMEGFLLPESKEGEYRFKFGLYGAWYLGMDSSERAKIFKDLTCIYDARSGIVHGSKPGAANVVMESAAKARELAGRLLVKGLEQGWPPHEKLKSMALGSMDLPTT